MSAHLKIKRQTITSKQAQKTKDEQHEHH